MKKVINVFLSILKIILLFVSFALTFYIIVAMYDRLEKSILEAIDIFIPYILLLMLILLNHVLGQKRVTSNIFYNLTCCIVFALFIFVDFRTIFDNYMLLSLKNSYNMSFYYFSDMVIAIKLLLYLLIGGNISLMIYGAICNKEDKLKEKEFKVKSEAEQVVKSSKKKSTSKKK